MKSISSLAPYASNETFKYKPLQNTHRYETWEGQYIQVHGGGISKKKIIGNIYRPPKDLNANYKCFTYVTPQDQMSNK